MSSFFPALHLDSPILDVNVKRAKVLCLVAEQDHGSPWTNKQWYKYAEGLGDAYERSQFRGIGRVFTRASSQYKVSMDKVRPVSPEMYPYLLNVPTAPRTRTDRVLNHAEAAIKPLIAAHVLSLAGLTGSPIEQVPATMIPERARHFYAVEEVYAALIEGFASERNKGADRITCITRDFCRGVISESICVISLGSEGGQWYSLTYQQLLMLRDAAMMRRNGHIAAACLYPDDAVLSSSIDASFRFQELCLELFGNRGYELAKAVEYMSKAYIARVGGDVLSGDGDSFDGMLRKAAEKERDFRELSEEDFPDCATLAHVYYHQVLKPLTTVGQVCELFGLQKFSGHPLIDPRVTSAKSRKVAQAADPTNPAKALQLRAVFSDMFTRTYIAKHKAWPPLEFVKEGTELQRLYEGRVLSLSRQNYDLSDWDYANFTEVFEFDEYENYFELIDDRSISHLLSEKHSTWDQTPTSTHKRLLLELLRRFHVDTHDIIQAIEEDRIPIDWLICSLYPKEREFKLAARAFTMMVFEMRAFFTIHEANLAETVLKYFPSITMTDSKLDIHRRFLNMTRPLSSPDMVRLLLELDLSSWNLMWRGIIVEGVGQQLNGMFGLKHVYTTVHKFFEKCCMMMRVAGCRPDEVEKLWPPESDLVHYDHAGGLEGIAQKLWSICTVAMIQMAMHGLGVSYTITDQGDNIVLVVSAARDWNIDLKTQLSTLAAEILSRCSAAATDVHQELKPEECLVSTIVLTYSKIIYVDGVDYPTALKALSRIYPASAVDFPSVASYIGSIFSGCYTASESIKTPERCYRLALLHGSLFLTRATQQSGPYTQTAKNRPHMFSLEGIRLQLLWPSELGGYPTIGPYSFLYKGGGDPLSKSIAGLKMLQDHSPDARSIIGAFQSDSLYDPAPTLTSMVQDPYSLPIVKPPTPGDSVAKDTLAVMKGLTSNQEISQVLEFATDAYEEQLITALGTMRPFNPLIAHKLLEASAVGTVNNLKKMGLKTQTIQSIARSDTEGDIIPRMIAAGVKEIDSLWSLIIRFSSESGTIESVYDEVQRARRRWAPCGSVPEGITSYMPIDFALIWDPAEDVPGIIVEYCTHGQDAFYTRGPNTAFLGSATASKYSDHGYRIVGRDHASSALRALQVVLAWCETDPDTLEVIDYLSLMRSGIELSDYALALVGVYGGNSGHRFNAYFGSRSASLLGQSAFAHFVTIFSDKAGYLSASNQDYAIMWQEFFCYMIAMCSYRWSRTKHVEHGRLILVIGSEPLDSLPDNRLRFVQPVLPPAFPGINRLIQSDQVVVKQTGGPIWSSAITLHVDPTEPYEFSALVSVLSRALGGRVGMQGVVDSVTTSVNIAIGVAELIGMGLTTFLEACSCALLDTVQGIVHSPMVATRFNANVNYLVQKYGKLLLSIVAPYLTHPLLAKDPVIVRLNIGPGPKYDQRYSADRLLLSELSRVMLKLYHNNRSTYYSYSIVVFGSDTLDATEQSVIRMLRRLSSAAVVTGLITYDEGQFMIGSPIRRLVRSRISDKTERITTFRDILLTYNEYKRGNSSLSAPAVNILAAIANSAGQARIWATRTSADEIVRRYRGGRPREVTQKMRRIPRAIGDGECEIYKLSGYTEATILTPTEHTVLKFNHAYGESRSLGSGAMSTWVELGSRFVNQAVLVVGSGLGACAAAAIMGGARKVIGHDLRTDYPPHISLSEYNPPLIRLYGCERLYRQSEETLSTSGDWFDPKVARMLLSTMPDEFSVVVDISSDRGFSKDVLKPIILSAFDHTAYVRIVAGRRVHEEVVGILERTCRAIEAWTFIREGPLLERVYCFRVLHREWPLFVHPHEIHARFVQPRFSGRQTSDQLASYILAPLGGITGRTIRDSLVAGLAIFEGMITDLSTRPTFGEWTEVLYAAAACEILLVYSRQEFLCTLSSLVIGDLYTLLGHHSIRLFVTQRFITFLSTTVCRIAEALDRQVTHQIL